MISKNECMIKHSCFFLFVLYATKSMPHFVLLMLWIWQRENNVFGTKNSTNAMNELIWTTNETWNILNEVTKKNELKISNAKYEIETDMG